MAHAMTKTAWFLLLTFSSLSAAHAAGACKIDALGGLTRQKVGAWEVSLEKEAKRNKPGDALAIVETATGKRCEAELDSWGVKLYAAKAEKTFVVVVQGDTGDGQLTWIDPALCKPVSTVRAAGRVKLTAATANFSGGKDGPAVIEPTKFPLGRDCLPSE